MEDEEKEILFRTLNKVCLTGTQIGNILSVKREQNSIYTSLKKIIENPYLLCEQYVGMM